MTTQYWTYDPSTREIISGPHAAQFRGGVWHIPRNAITAAPLPPQPGQAVLALPDGSGTEYVEDHRGKTVYSKQTRESQQLTALGPIPDDLTELPPGPDDVWGPDGWQLDPEAVHRHAARKTADINAWRDAQEAENLQFGHGGHQWDGGTMSKSRMDETLALATATGGLPDGFFWTAAANVDVPLTVAELQALAAAMAAARGQRGFEIHARQRAMKTDIAALADLGDNPGQQQLADAIAAIQAYVVDWEPTHG